MKLSNEHFAIDVVLAVARLLDHKQKRINAWMAHRLLNYAVRLEVTVRDQSKEIIKLRRELRKSKGENR
jgi:hypothetical protein